MTILCMGKYKKGCVVMELNKEKIGAKIKLARKEKGYTQEQLADMIELSNRTINLMEKGKSGMTLETLIKFCNALDVSPNYVLSYKPSEEDISKILDNFTNKQKDLIKEFLSVFEKLSETYI